MPDEVLASARTHAGELETKVGEKTAAVRSVLFWPFGVSTGQEVSADEAIIGDAGVCSSHLDHEEWRTCSRGLLTRVSAE